MAGQAKRGEGQLPLVALFTHVLRAEQIVEGNDWRTIRLLIQCASSILRTCSRQQVWEQLGMEFDE